MKWLSKCFRNKGNSIKLESHFLKRIDEIQINLQKKEIILFGIFRNEKLRLPHFLEYYKTLGVDKFILVDNGSNDGSKEIILKDKSIHLFYTEEVYKNHWYWMEYLLEMYGKDHWCIVVDIYNVPQKLGKKMILL